MKKAIAYACDVILGRTGEVISRDYQKDLIRKHAEENGIEIVRWFEDEMYEEDILSRPGVRAMLACEESCDMLLVERVWSLSRSWPALTAFFNELETKGRKLESATTMWDCVSQMCRRRFDSTLAGPKAKKELVASTDAMPVHIKKPARLVFATLKSKPSLVRA